MQVEIDHSRKGKFTGFVVWQSDEWIDVQITDGTAKYTCTWNGDAEPDDVIRIRKSLCTITEVPDPDGPTEEK